MITDFVSSLGTTKHLTLMLYCLRGIILSKIIKLFLKPRVFVNLKLLYELIFIQDYEYT